MKQYEDDKIIFELAKQGMSDEKIAIHIHYNRESVYKRIKTLITEEHPNYNPSLYSQILIERSLINNPIVDKDLLDNIVNMILNDYLLIEIAVFTNLKKNELEKILFKIKENKSNYYDATLIAKINKHLSKNKLEENINQFKRILKLEKQYPTIKLEDYGFNLKSYRYWQRCNAVINDFLYDTTDLQILGMRYNMNFNSIRNIINQTDKGQFLQKYYDKEAINTIKQLYRKSIENIDIKLKTYNNSDPIDNEKINKIANNSRFWILFLLTFRISINDLAKMFKIKNIEKLHNVLVERASFLSISYEKALKYLDNNFDSQNLPKAINFYKEYIKAKQTNLKKAKEMIKVIDDYEFLKLLKSGKKISEMTADEHRLIADYWVKYALNVRALPYDLKALNKYCIPYREEEIKKIKDYNCETSVLYTINKSRRLKK